MQQLIAYSIKETLYYTEMFPVGIIGIGAPVLSSLHLETSDTVIVLCTKGLRQYDYIPDDESETTTNAIQSSNSSSSSPIQHSD